MTPVFGDTAFYVAFQNRRDSLHARAVALAAGLTAPIVTSEFVLIEVANFFKRPGDRAWFTAFDSALRADDATTIIPATSALYARGRDLFSARADQPWSLVD